MALTILVALVSGAAAAQTTETSGAFWPAVDLHVPLASNLKLLAFGELKTDEDFPYRQANFGASLGYQWSRMSGPHRVNNDGDKENFLVTAVGYEHLETIQSGSDKFENRILVDATPRVRPTGRLLLADRNRVEFRWVDGAYSTRYRNRLTAEYDLEVKDFLLTPYASAEFFYNITKGTWNEEQYAAGVTVPYRKLLSVDLYYLRQNCPGCGPPHLNVFGLTVNVHLDLGL